MRIFVLTPFCGAVRDKIIDSIEALQELGHEVESFELQRRENPPGAKLNESRASELRYRIKNFQPDFLLTSDHRGFDPRLIQNLKIPHVSWFSNNPFYWLRKEWISPTCVVFIWDASYINQLKNFGFKNVFYLPLATNPKLFKETSLSQEDIEKYSCDVSFAGASGISFYKDVWSKVERIEDAKLRLFLKEVIKRRSQNPLKEFIEIIKEVENSLGVKLHYDNIKTLERELDLGAMPLYRKSIIQEMREFDVRVWGDEGWGEHLGGEMEESYCGKIDRANLKKLYKATKINLNITSTQSRTGLNMRVFDIAACGGFLLSDYRRDLEELLSWNLAYRDKVEAKALANYYLIHEDERLERAKSLQKIVLRFHTYKHRMKELVDNVCRVRF
jgi:spore maturation protein CgeB